MPLPRSHAHNDYAHPRPLLDAALVRLVLLPVLLRLLGRWAWYLPKPLGRLLPDVRFGHA